MVSKKIIKQITEEIVNACDPQLVLLFGSYSRDVQTEDSDLDIFVVAELQGSASERKRAIRRAISIRGVSLDVIVRSSAEYKKALHGRDWFVQEIARDGKVLYAR